MRSVLGVDGCRGGWCAVILEVGDQAVRPSEPRVYPTFTDLLDTSADLICIDIPIGLSKAPRACDLEARRVIGHPGGSRVFPPPCREALAATTYREACDINRRVTGRAISQQAFGIMPQIREVDEGMSSTLQERVREVHPEVCFRTLAGEFVRPKKKPGGISVRWALLRRVLPALPDAPSLPPEIRGRSALDDYLDALVAAWTGVCILRGTAGRIPEAPSCDVPGLRMEIWHPAVG